MNLFGRYLTLVLVSIYLLSACSSKPVEKYVDYFYSYKNNEQKDSFTYILYLGEEGYQGPPQDGTDPSITPQRQESKQSAKSRKSSKRGSADDFMSISFRMEEEAFDRLEKMLLAKKYCTGKVEYTDKEYTWLRYTIKGFCK